MMIQSPEIASDNKLRLTILYALRYQKYSANAVSQTIDLLLNNGVSESDAALVHVMLNFAGAEQRQDDLFMNENFFSRGKSAMKGLKVSRSTWRSTFVHAFLRKHRGCRALRMSIPNIHHTCYRLLSSSCEVDFVIRVIHFWNLRHKAQYSHVHRTSSFS